MSFELEICRLADTVTTHWANGKGETRELRRWPLGSSFHWRLSIATIASDESFSRFAGIDRALMALSPDGLTLRIEDDLVSLGQFESISFAGEDRVFPMNVRTASIDLNLLVQRGSATPTLSLLRVEGPTVVNAMAIVAVGGAPQVMGSVLEFGDSVFQDAEGTSGNFSLDGSGLIAFARR